MCSARIYSYGSHRSRSTAKEQKRYDVRNFRHRFYLSTTRTGIPQTRQPEYLRNASIMLEFCIVQMKQAYKAALMDKQCEPTMLQTSALLSIILKEFL
ncbi:hypothetical protein V1478_006695 [Vespula squamosa]|uniref:Uncharacterized protein n=1 Tax=Vespula squamosa TaxID=30214 RepID=A0ABD2B0N0_VESSQ